MTPDTLIPLQAGSEGLCPLHGPYRNDCAVAGLYLCPECLAESEALDAPKTADERIAELERRVEALEAESLARRVFR